MRTTLLLLILVATTAAHADPIVLAIDGKDIYVQLGARDGVGAGSELELEHEVIVKDPRTKATLRDHFALGTLTVEKSGDGISVAHADPELAKRVLPGDLVRLLSPKRTFDDPWAAKVAASKASAPLPPPPAGTAPIDHVELVRHAWQDTLGQPPYERIARWNALVVADPQSPYRRAIETEIASLRTQIAQHDAALEKARSTSIDDRSPRIARLVAALDRSAAPPRDASRPPRGALEAATDPLLIASVPRAMPGQPIELAFLARQPAQIGHAWLYARARGEPGYRRIELRRDGDAYFRGTIEAAAVRAGTVEWYAEISGTGADAATGPVIGSATAPQEIAVESAVTEAPIAAGRSHVDMHVDYVDFDGGFNKGFDQYYQAEVDFGYRFLDPIYAVRLGFGTLSGTGGPKEVIDAAPDTCLDPSGNYRCKRVTFSYVYTELEYRVRPNVALMLRPQAGLLTTDTMSGSGATRCQGRSIDGCDFLTGFGARGRIRLGEEAGTNLVLGVAFTRGVGALFEAAYHWLPTPLVPVQFSVQVTDQPVVEDFGVRLIGDVGLRRFSWFYPSLRVSYQARDINHSGLSGGMALNFDW